MLAKAEANMDNFRYLVVASAHQETVVYAKECIFVLC